MPFAAEAVDDQRGGDAALRRGDQCGIDAPSGRVVGIDVVENAQVVPGAVDQREQRVEPARAGVEQRQPVAVDGERRLGSGIGHHPSVAGSRASHKRG